MWKWFCVLHSYDLFQPSAASKARSIFSISFSSFSFHHLMCCCWSSSSLKTFAVFVIRRQSWSGDLKNMCRYAYLTKCFTFWGRLVWRKNNLILALTEKALFLRAGSLTWELVWLYKASTDVVWLPQTLIDELFRPQKCETFGRIMWDIQQWLRESFVYNNADPIISIFMWQKNFFQRCLTFSSSYLANSTYWLTACSYVLTHLQLSTL